MSIASISPSPCTAPRHPFEMFRFGRWDWDIARFWKDHDAGLLRLKRIELDRDFIETYATSVLCQDPAQKKVQTRFSVLAGVNVAQAMALPVEALKEPVVFLQVPRAGVGIVRFDGHAKARHVLADGNHRVARAYHDALERLSAYVLTPKQSDVYLA